MVSIDYHYLLLLPWRRFWDDFVLQETVLTYFEDKPNDYFFNGTELLIKRCKEELWDYGR